MDRKTLLNTTTCLFLFQANEMLLAGRKLTAVEARDCGLVTDVIPHDKFEEEIQKRVQAMAKLPPQVNIF